MPRSPRPNFTGGLYHVGTRGDRQEPIFLDDDDRVWFLLILADVVKRFGWKCHAYCLMTNHYHLLIETPDANLSPGMERLNGLHARSFNAKHGYKGHVFERRFHHELVENEAHLLELARYIVLNPVRGGICSYPREWPWSSYRATVGLADVPTFLSIDWLLGAFGTTLDRARVRYAEFVAAAIPDRAGAWHGTRPVQPMP